MAQNTSAIEGGGAQGPLIMNPIGAPPTPGRRATNVDQFMNTVLSTPAPFYRETRSSVEAQGQVGVQVM